MTYATKESLLKNAMSVEDLITLLQDCPKDAKVFFTTNYGDHNNTDQALPVTDSVEETAGVLEESGYSRSGFSYEEAGHSDTEGFCDNCEEDYDGFTTCPTCGEQLVNEDGNSINLNIQTKGIVILS